MLAFEVGSCDVFYTCYFELRLLHEKLFIKKGLVGFPANDDSTLGDRALSAALLSALSKKLLCV